MSLANKLGLDNKATQSLTEKMNFEPLNREEHTLSVSKLREIKSTLLSSLRNTQKQQAQITDAFEVKCEAIGEKKVCMNFELTAPEQLRSAAISARQQHPEALIIFVVRTQERFLIAIASHKFSANDFFEKLKKVLLNLRGGGSGVLAQGSFEDGDYDQKIKNFVSE